ncbi:hypothetical protein scyTo_0022920, partial [Scyliorhinus torazame]|nr:hypothetical protein [Scyliorhinus torazame]
DATGEQGVIPDATGEQGIIPDATGEQGVIPDATGEQGPDSTGEQGVIPDSTGEQGIIPEPWRELLTLWSTGERVEVWRAVNMEQLEGQLLGVLSRGIQSLAVVLLHSYTFSTHEKQIGELAKRLGFKHISLSSEVMPMVRAVPRGYTACADAYLTPCIKRYLSGFCAGFQDNLKDVRVLFMQSDGGLTPMERFNGSRAILSGPAGGVVGYAVTTHGEECAEPVIGFDMGGTSTDVSRYAGEYEHVFEAVTAGITVQAPQLDVNTVAAGGGSILAFR